MKRFFALCLALSLATVFTAGCEYKTKTQKQDTVSTPGGSTTTTDTHTVESKGDNPPPNASGETAK